MYLEKLRQYIGNKDKKLHLNKSKLYKTIEIKIEDKKTNEFEEFVIKYKNYEDFIYTYEKLRGYIKGTFMVNLYKKIFSNKKNKCITDNKRKFYNILQKDFDEKKVKYHKIGDLNKYIISKTQSLTNEDKLKVVKKLKKILETGNSSVNKVKKGHLSTCETINLHYFTKHFPKTINDQEVIKKINSSYNTSLDKLDILIKYLENNH